MAEGGGLLEKPPAAMAEGGGLLEKSPATADVRRRCGGGFPAAGGRRTGAVARTFYASKWRSSESASGLVGSYCFVLTRGTRWWSCLHEILNG
ncbi:hypothetical protein DY000_02060201 [Brassica cretica]|uniref:Uncharacterized protein n=1 Tax=Brassica cretica TaxID=69181 RepID=A0ABQ7ASR1_BRACR|nr:hypothetical protein DY000_02060201 [Brassica cretica]